MLSLKVTLLLICALLPCVFSQCNPIQSNLCPDFGTIYTKLDEVAFNTQVQGEINNVKQSLLNKSQATCTQQIIDSSVDSTVRYLKSYACSVAMFRSKCDTTPGVVSTTQNKAICKTICPIIYSSVLKITQCANGVVKENMQKTCEMVSENTNCLDYATLEMDTCGFSSAPLKQTFCSNAVTTDGIKCCGGAATSSTPATQSTQVVKASPTSSTTTTSTKKQDVEEEKESSGGSIFKNKIFITGLICVVLVIAILGFFYYVGRGEDELEDNDDEYKNPKDAGFKNMNEQQSHSINMNSPPFGGKNEMSSSYKNIVNDNSDMYGNLGYNGLDNNQNPSSNYPYTQPISNPFDDRNTSNLDNYNDLNPSYQNAINGNNNKPVQIQNNEVSYQSPSLFAAPSNDNTRQVQNPFESPSMNSAAPSPYNQYDQVINNNMNMNNDTPTTPQANVDDEAPSKMMVNMIDIPKPQQNNTDMFGNDINNNDEPKKAMVNLTEIPKPQQNNTNIFEDMDEDSKPKPAMVNITQIASPKQTSLSANDAPEANVNENEEPKKAMVNMIEVVANKSNGELDVMKTPSILLSPALDQPSVNNENDPSQQAQADMSELPEAKPYNAIHTYEPQINDELKLEIGDKVDVIYEYDDGWVWAINKTNGEQGACPLLCLASAKEEETGEREWEKQMDLMKVPGRRDSMLSIDSNRLSQIKMKFDTK